MWHLTTLCGHTRTQSDAVTAWQWMPGFLVYLYLYKNKALVSSLFIYVNFRGGGDQDFHAVQLAPQILWNTLRLVYVKYLSAPQG